MQVYTEFSEPQSHFGSVRRPIQCEGAERGPRRTAEVGVFTSVNPQQFSIGSSLGLLPNILPFGNLF